MNTSYPPALPPLFPIDCLLIILFNYNTAPLNTGGLLPSIVPFCRANSQPSLEFSQHSHPLNSVAFCSAGQKACGCLFSFQMLLHSPWKIIFGVRGIMNYTTVAPSDSALATWAWIWISADGASTPVLWPEKLGLGPSALNAPLLRLPNLQLSCHLFTGSPTLKSN